MSPTTSPAARRTRLQTLLLIRRWIAIVMLAFTALLALLWVWPKGSVGPIWLVCLVPAALILVLLWKAAPPNSEFRVPVGRALGLSAVLFVLWIGGIFVMDAWGPESWGLAGAWGWLQVVWPVVMAAGLIARFIVRRFIPAARTKDSIDQHRQRELLHEQRLTREMNSQVEPTAPGRMTGYEPAALKATEPVPSVHMHGTPGVGLAGSGFDAEQIAKGQEGEENFARALQRAGMLSRFATFWSVHMPDEEVGASQTLRADIDAVVVTGRSIVLLDMKNYHQGDVTWLMEDGRLRLIDNPTGGYIGKPRGMSRSMELALSRMTTKFRSLGVRRSVTARIVFMPTDNGIGTIDPAVRWPGQIPALALDQVLSELAEEPDFDPAASDAEHIVRVLHWLVKDETGSAPQVGEAWKHAPGMRRPRSSPAGGGSRTTSPQGPSRPSAPASARPGTGEAATAADPAAPASTSAPTGSTAPTDSTAAAPSTGSTASASTASDASAARRCPECGATFQPEWTFCWECGHA